MGQQRNRIERHSAAAIVVPESLEGRLALALSENLEERLALARVMADEWDAFERELFSRPMPVPDPSKMASEEEQRALEEAFANDTLPEFCERYPMEPRGEKPQAE